jgi:hypothetical protein
MIVRPVERAKSAVNQQERNVGATSRGAKAATNKYARLILSRGLDTPSRKHLVTDLVV